MLSGGLVQIDVVSVRKQCAISLPRRHRQGLFSSPGVNDNISRSIGLKNLIPSLHDLVVGSNQLLDPLGEIELQSCIILQAMVMHKGLDARICIPFLSIAL